MHDRIEGKTLPTLHRTVVAAFGSVVTVLFILSCASMPGSQKRFTEAEIYLKRGDGFFFKAMYGQAIAEYSNAIISDDGMAEAYRARGNAYLAQKAYGKALEDFERAIEIDPSFAEGYLGRGVIHYRRGNYAEAIDDFSRVIELDPWNANARYYKAISCERVGRLREAVEAYKGYIHCTVNREESNLEAVRERIKELEAGPIP